MINNIRNICKLLFSLLFMAFYGTAFGQTDWVKKEIGNKIYVSFPTSSKFDFVNKTGVYTSKTDNCIFMALAQQGVIPDYNEFVKLSAANQNEVIELFLDNAIKGMLIQSENEGTPFKNIKIGKYSGREVSYSALNPVTGYRTTKYVQLFFALNYLYAFQTFATKDGVSCINEKIFFF